MLSEAATRDSLWGGRLTLWQPARRRGYRFNLDPVLLAGFAPAGGTIIDLGAGCGVLGLLLAALGKAERVTAVEIQPELAALATRNAADNALPLTVLTSDLRHATLPRADGAVFNPPYVARGEGRTPPDAGRLAARHETHGTLEDFVAAAAAAVPEGFLCAILPLRRRAELLRHLASHGFAAARVRTVQPRPNAEPQLVMLEARRGATHCREESPLVVHEADGHAFSPEVRALVEGPRASR